jgi:hypothetical protein
MTGDDKDGAAPFGLLELYPAGYPVVIDVPQAYIHGIGTAMHFVLPLRAHNFPLTHRNEHKLVVALAGSVRLQRGSATLAHLQCGQSALVAPHAAHRIHQDGAAPSMVGVALWPGAVKDAFRRLAAMVATRGFKRTAVIALLAEYQVEWDATAVPGDTPEPLATGAFDDLLSALPPALAAALSVRWAGWLQAC